MGNDSGIPTSISENPYILLALLVAGVLGIFFGALNKSTTGFGAWLSSLRRIGADAKAADIVARDAQIENLSRDLATERRARQNDRDYFTKEMERRDRLSRAHVQWDWKVYNILIKAELWPEDVEGPPPLL